MGNPRTKTVKMQKIPHPRILISALRGSSAKTIVTLGMIVAFIRRGLKIFPYKKGPDYIDAAWLSQAAGEICDHLDLYIMGVNGVCEVFYRRVNPETVSNTASVKDSFVTSINGNEPNMPNTNQMEPTIRKLFI